jgi:hypothetical protein
MTFIFSLFIPILLVGYAGLEGAVLSYLFIEAILFVLLSWEYLKIRLDPTVRNSPTNPDSKESLDTEGSENPSSAA